MPTQWYAMDTDLMRRDAHHILGMRRLHGKTEMLPFLEDCVCKHAHLHVRIPTDTHWNPDGHPSFNGGITDCISRGGLNYIAVQ